MLIRDVVRQREDVAFRNDVQLRWYVEGGSENLALARSYMFTRKSVGQRKSPIDVLYQLRQAFLTNTFENRFMVIATYGHGKSHLALGLANYFGKAAGSEECQALLASIEHAFGGAAEAQGYRDFKESRKRMLVVCLEGTRPGDLAQHFLKALRTALRAEPETRNQELPFWTREAARLIESIAASEQERVRADTFLQGRGTDLAGLREALNGQDTSSYELVREVVYQVRGVRPDLGGPISLAHAVEWAADEFCGMEESKPFGGLLILFDEFSAFLRNYSIRATPGNPLQDLLDGVSNRKGKVVFAAFGQLDPTATVESVFSMHANDGARQGLLVELTRLPPAYHYQLYTTMEDVLDAYLRQDEKAVTQAFEDGRAWPAVEEATDDCLMVFDRRYVRELGWDAEQFQKRVTMGCFPLHPMTAALLCNIELLESTNPRSVLGFLFDELGRIGSLPVVTEQRPSWVAPIRLVDQFGEQLADEEWKQYEDAVRQRAGDLTAEEGAILKAMLLHAVAQMPTHLVVYTKAIADLCGMTAERAEEVLQGLTRIGVIEHQIAQGKYGFWSLGGGARRLHEWLNRAITGRSLTWNDLVAVNRDGRGFPRPSLPVPVPWGHQNDWQAEQVYLTRSFVTVDKVKEMAGGSRGAVIWLVAASDDDVEWFDNNAQRILDAAAGDPAAPIVMMAPATARPALMQAILKHCALKGLTPAEVTDFGGGFVQSVKAQVARTIQDETTAMEATLRRVLVPQPFAAAYNAGTPLSRADLVIKKAYELAFGSAPPAFFDQYKLSSGQLRTAVKLVGKLILENKVGDLNEGANPTADLLLRKFMVVGEATSWGLLSVERRLQEPAAERTRRAWDKLEGCIPANGTDVALRPALIEIQGPPYGYDVNTLTLLFCAWYGYHRHNLRMTVNGAITQRSELATRLEGSPAELVEFLTEGNVRLMRQDRSKSSQEVRDIAERARRMTAQPFARREAVDALAKLEEFLGDEGNEDLSERQEAEEAKTSVQAAVDRADAYDTSARQLRATAGGATDIAELVRMIERVRDLQPAGGVLPSEPLQDAIRTEIRNRLGVVVGRVCAENTELPDLTHYQDKRRRLESAQRALSEHLDLKQKVTDALQALESAKAEHHGRQQDQTTIAVLNTMQTSGALGQLRSWLDCAEKPVCHSEMAKTLQRQKVEGLKTAISKMEEFASSLDGRLDRVKSSVDVEGLSQAIGEVRGLYAGAPEADTLAVAAERCGSLAKVFAGLGQVDALIEGLRRRNDVQGIENRLAGLLSEHSSSMCPEQEAVLRQRSSALADRVREMEEEAVNWLNDRKRRVAAGGALGNLADELQSPPAFLPTGCDGDLRALLVTVQQKMDEDLSGQVVRYFKRITNKAEQKRVVADLQRIVDGQ